MTEKILVVTAPDDTLLQGIRIAHVNLTHDQSQLVSQALMQSQLSNTIINYVWNIGNDIEWFIDKIYKSDLVIFDAEHPGAELIHGWLAAHPQSYYFGNLRDLHLVNDRAILHSDQLITILETVSKHYE
jgi:hypothetical protein